MSMRFRRLGNQSINRDNHQRFLNAIPIIANFDIILDKNAIQFME